MANFTALNMQFKNFFGKKKEHALFNIYTMSALSANTNQDLIDSSVVTFDSAYSYSYQLDADIPYQPIEDGTFTTDSVLTHPFMLRVIGALSMAAVANSSIVGAIASGFVNYHQNSVLQPSDVEGEMFGQIGEITQRLNDLAGDVDNQLIIFKGVPFFQAYLPMHLKSVSYEVNPDRTTLFANMEFQQTRSTDVYPFIYPLSQVTAQEALNNNILQQPQNQTNVVETPTNTDPINNGIVQPFSAPPEAGFGPLSSFGG